MSWKLLRTQQLQRARDHLDSRKKHNCGTIVVRYFEDEKYKMRMHEQGYAQSDMVEFDRRANEKKGLRGYSYRTGLLQRPIQEVQPYQGGDSDTVKTDENPEYKQVYCGMWKTLPNNTQNPMLNSGHRGLHGHD